LRTQRLTGLVALVAVAGSVACLGTGTDVNPNDVRHETVTGTWIAFGLLAPDVTVTFRPDSTFELTDTQRVTGRWSVQDWNLTLNPGGGDVEYWRVIKHNGEHQLLRHYCGIEDDCGKRQLTFRRE
jgi:hypothetical protein